MSSVERISLAAEPSGNSLFQVAEDQAAMYKAG
jgi:hypothetical protein